jgi:tetratricopeptide (TPR) repeat protein
MALQAEFSQGMALHSQGELAGAERIYREVLRQHPHHFGALHMLGVIALQTGHAEQAANLIRKAIVLNAEVAAAHYNLGKTSNGSVVTEPFSPRADQCLLPPECRQTRRDGLLEFCQ